MFGTIWKYGLFTFLSLGMVIAGPVWANGAGENDDVRPPNELGRFNIGYRGDHDGLDPSEVLIDPDRQLPSGADRPLQVGIWYPTKDKTGTPAMYSWIGFDTQVTPEHSDSVFSEANVAAGKHPLLVYSHGGGGGGWDHYELFETLASHGFIVVGVNHTGNDSMSQNADFAGFPCPLEDFGQLGPGCSFSTNDLRPGDVSFVIDEMLNRNQTGGDPFFKSIREDKIGAIGLSFGGGTTLMMAGGRTASPAILPDERVKAILLMEPSAGLTSTADKAIIDIPVLTMAGSPLAGLGVVRMTEMFENELPLASPNYLIEFRDIRGEPDPIDGTEHPRFDCSLPECDPEDLDPIDIWASHISFANSCELRVPIAATGGAKEDPILSVAEVFLTFPFALTNPDSVFASLIYQLGNFSTLLGSRRMCPEFDDIQAGLYVQDDPSRDPFYQRGQQMDSSEALDLLERYAVSFFNVHLRKKSGYNQFLTPEFAAENGLSTVVHCKDNKLTDPKAPKCAAVNDN